MMVIPLSLYDTHVMLNVEATEQVVLSFLIISGGWAYTSHHTSLCEDISRGYKVAWSDATVQGWWIGSIAQVHSDGILKLQKGWFNLLNSRPGCKLYLQDCKLNHHVLTWSLLSSKGLNQDKSWSPYPPDSIQNAEIVIIPLEIVDLWIDLLGKYAMVFKGVQFWVIFESCRWSWWCSHLSCLHLWNPGVGGRGQCCLAGHRFWHLSICSLADLNGLFDWKLKVFWPAEQSGITRVSG